MNNVDAKYNQRLRAVYFNEFKDICWLFLPIVNLYLKIIVTDITVQFFNCLNKYY